MVIKKKTKGLGRGLDALLGSDSNALDELSPEKDAAGLQQIQVTALQAGKYQPRSIMDDTAIDALAESIAQQGVMQPLLVRRLQGEQVQYEVIAGERRLRAAIKAGLAEVPVIIKDVDDEQAAVMALIENIQREDLNPMEEARGIRRLLDEFALTHDQIAGAIGRSRSATSNILRLLNLAAPVQELLMQGSLDMGHARALLPLQSAEQIQAANLIVAKGLSVRQAEQLVTKGLHTSGTRAQRDQTPNQDVLRMQEQLADRLGSKVALKASNKGTGHLTVHFHDWEQFHGLLEKFGLTDLIDKS
ncbi:MAG TPA: ParB/RepB/Spo0J family partition protein [Orrella sp.]